jgi:hypothetical protein
MRRLSRPRTRAALHLAAMAGVLALAAGFVAQSAGPAHAELTPDNGLLVSTREDFRLCVHATGAARTANLDARVTEAVAEVREHPDWEAAFGATGGGARAAVAGACPAVELPDGPLTRTSLVGPGLTEDPSPYRTWVHVLDDATADRLLGPDRDAMNVPAEMMRTDERNSAAVSTAVLVRAGHLDDPGFRGGLLTEGIGLRATVAAPDGPASVKHGPADGAR